MTISRITVVTVYSLNDFSTGGSDADGNRMKVGHLELTDCTPEYSACPAHKNKQTHIVTSQQEDGTSNCVLTAGLGFGGLYSLNKNS